MSVKLTKLKEEIDRNTVIVDFNNLLSIHSIQTKD